MDDIVKRIRQQSYFGLEPYEAADEIEQLRQRVQELEERRCEICGYAEHHREHTGCLRVKVKELTAERDALKQQRDELLAALEKFLDDNNPEGFGCACEPGRLCGPCSEAKRQRPLYAAIASVNELQNGY